MKHESGERELGRRDYHHYRPFVASALAVVCLAVAVLMPLNRGGLLVVWRGKTGTIVQEPLASAHYRVHIAVGRPYFEYRYLGCFSDDKDHRELEYPWTAYAITPAMCRESCFAMGFAFAGLQEGDMCWCGNGQKNIGGRSGNGSASNSSVLAIGRYGQLDDYSCRLPCTGNMSLLCGGHLASVVYHIRDYSGAIRASSTKPVGNTTTLLPSTLHCQQLCLTGRYTCTGSNLYLARSHVFNTRSFTVLFLRDNTSTVTFTEMPLASDRYKYEVQQFRQLLSAPHNATLGSLQLSTVDDIYHLSITVLDIDLLREEQPNLSVARTIRQPSFLFGRFMPLNIMHVIHDDMTNAYFAMQTLFADPFGPASTSPQIILLDAYAPGPYVSLLQLLSKHPVHHMWEFVAQPVLNLEDVERAGTRLDRLSRNDRAERYRRIDRVDAHNREHELVRFANVSIGMPPSMAWYQYGFTEPQGPLPHTRLIEHSMPMGIKLREFVRFVRASLPSTWSKPHTLPMTAPCIGAVHVNHNVSKAASNVKRRLSRVYSMSDQEFRSASEVPGQPRLPGYIAILSRSQNRRIVNEDELMLDLEAAFPHLTPVIVRLEDSPLTDVINILAHSAVALGMHGSALILVMFMPPGGLLIECFPYAVPADNYTPYKTMATLYAFGLEYAAWENKRIEDTYTFPDRAASLGGVQELAPEVKEAVLTSTTVPSHLCCTDPHWLFRIYQDTRVAAADIVSMVRGHLDTMFPSPRTKVLA
ncbi:Protein O-linked-mannose beta-1,4-N-acetylglucosaminyltransferase 2 [Sorochytrium milnesiophthora]